MKTSFKRFAALALAAIMVLGTMNLSAWADTTAVGNRTVDGALVISGLQNGDVVRFYKVLEENMNATVEGGWVYTSKFIAMSKPTAENGYNMPVSTLIGNSAAGRAAQVNADTVGNLARLIAIESQTPMYIAVAENGKATVSNPEPGMYIAIINPIDKDYVYNPVIVSADYVSSNPSASWNVTEKSSYSNNAAAKMSTIQIEKSASTVEQAPDDVKPTTTAIGDSVSFSVETTVPGYGDVYITPSFVLTDTLDGLKLDGEPVVTNVVTNQPLRAGATGADDTSDTVDYQLVKKQDGTGYTVTFTERFLKTLVAPLDIKVTYNAIVTNEAALNVNVENNTVEIKYSTNPTHSDDGRTETTPRSEDFSVKFDETNHYTFTIDSSALYNKSNSKTIGKSTSEWVKVGLNADGTTRIETSTTTSQISTSQSEAGALQGATFRLYRDAACEIEYIPKDTNGNPIAATAGTDATLYTSGPDGRFTIKGLDAGDYWLKEIEAPQGFIKRQTPVPIQIIADVQDKNVTKWYFGGTWYDTREEAVDKAKEAGYLDNDPAVIPRSNSTSKDFLYVCDMVKEYTASVPILQSYRIIIDGNEAAKHTFVHKSNSSTIEWSEGESHENPSPLENRQGVELPSTGGIGTTIFYAGGAMLVLLAGILLVSKRRIA